MDDPNDYFRFKEHTEALDEAMNEQHQRLIAVGLMDPMKGISHAMGGIYASVAFLMDLGLKRPVVNILKDVLKLARGGKGG